MTKSLVVLVAFFAVLSWTCLPWFLKLMSSDKLGLKANDATDCLKRTVATLEKENIHLKIDKNKLTVAFKVANKSASLNSNGVHEVYYHLL
ncbi:hypothetical protein L2E82_01135 [Cichorium intybus]|uniref:Uncharacterized protein n=1 Tax=Cichorium intybus TaxID=13427 RepID=A0ACB9GYG5_CICIN|nr:hypothetical protein L2E82_01135 [Cichorium intybus]